MTEDAFSYSVEAEGRTLKIVGTDADIILGKPGSPFGLLILIWADNVVVFLGGGMQSFGIISALDMFMFESY